jgi:hypothetical protein
MRYKLLRAVPRQILAFLIPGDFCDPHVTLLGGWIMGIEALTDCLVAKMPSTEIDRLTCDDTNLTRSLWLATRIRRAVLRSWLINNARRDAFAASRTC